LRLKARYRLLPLCFLAAILPLQARQTIAGNLPSAGLPDAPQPAFSEASTPFTKFHPQDQPSATMPLRPAPRLAKVISPGWQAVPLTAADKLKLAARQQILPFSFATQILSAGWGQLLDAHPKYGTDSAGFGERLGAASIRQGSQAIFADGVLPIFFHQDPRYYRLGSDKITHNVNRRIWYAASRVLIGKTDSGSQIFNYSKVIGYAGSAALTTTYYPDVSAGWGTVGKGYIISIFTAMLGNQLREFGPDVIHLVFYRHHG